MRQFISRRQGTNAGRQNGAGPIVFLDGSDNLDVQMILLNGGPQLLLGRGILFSQPLFDVDQAGPIFQLIIGRRGIVFKTANGSHQFDVEDFAIIFQGKGGGFPAIGRRGQDHAGRHGNRRLIIVIPFLAAAAAAGSALTTNLAIGIAACGKATAAVIVTAASAATLIINSCIVFN